MMRIQYDSLVKQIFKMCDEELELDTREGSEVFRAFMVALFAFHPDLKKVEAKNESEKRSD